VSSRHVRACVDVRIGFASCPREDQLFPQVPGFHREDSMAIQDLDTPRSRSITEMTHSARVISLMDARFDRFLPRDLRVLSSRYWIPLDVAAQAARWLDSLQISTVVDIGSGVGKFCIAGAMASRCAFIGIEHRPRLVRVARNLAARFDLDWRVKFVTTAFDEISTPKAECYFLFNPFVENLLAPDEHIDATGPLSHARYLRDISRVERLLSLVPIGTYVMTYNGFGGLIPPYYDDVLVDSTRSCELRLARRKRAARSDWARRRFG
jgi:hypothetical protein